MNITLLIEARISDAMLLQVASRSYPMSRAWWNVARRFRSTNIGSWTRERRLHRLPTTRWNAMKASSGRPVDVLLVPTMPYTAIPHRTLRYPGYTKLFNFLDYPTLSIQKIWFVLGPGRIRVLVRAIFLLTNFTPSEAGLNQPFPVDLDEIYPKYNLTIY